jgi:triosephosphate isomerase
MRKKFVAGNWKSFLQKQAAYDLLITLKHNIDFSGSGLPDVAVFPPSIYVENAVSVANETFKVGAQNCSAAGEGAYTGEVTSEMFASVGASLILAGHSERRQIFGETNAVIKSKVERILAAQITPVFCCGESLEIRNANTHKEFVFTQLTDSILHLSESDFSRLIIAYEPVWAIGTGINASPEQAQEMHAFIRNVIKEKYNDAIADNTRILYGGSVKPDNALALFSCADVDGGLVGGASLKAEDFKAIIQAAKQ